MHCRRRWRRRREREREESLERVSRTEKGRGRRAARGDFGAWLCQQSLTNVNKMSAGDGCEGQEGRQMTKN